MVQVTKKSFSFFKPRLQPFLAGGRLTAKNEALFS
ncbi:MAG: hypothetical protein LMBGKNDO_00267 [Bacteroidales bacterium]|jgi:hypothetical protein|nr:hypothetical protein [Bacteroidales bacterium]OQC56287.1 MAG: hypothetical protein BWX52_01763 [Bacteroidetes bacterium ADurb.Bin013]